MEKSLATTVSLAGDVAVLALAGRMDAMNSPVAEQALAALVSGGRKKIVIDARNLEYISSAGLRVLIATRKKLSPEGGDIRIAGLRPSVRSVFSIAGFDRIFALYDDPDKAAASFA